MQLEAEQYNSNWHAQDSRCMQAIILLFWAKVVMESEQQYHKWCLQGVKLYTKRACFQHNATEAEQCNARVRMYEFVRVRMESIMREAPGTMTIV